MPAWMRDRDRGKTPKPEQIRRLRLWTTALKQEMADVLHVSLRAYEEWEAGRSPMHANHWFAMRLAAAGMLQRRSDEAREIAEAREVS